MAYLKYYTEEQERHPVAHAAKCSEYEAMDALLKLQRHFCNGSTRKLEVVFTSGRNTSSASGRLITLNRDNLNWLLVVHEFAHYWHERRKHQKVQKLCAEAAPGYAEKVQRIQKQRHHGRHHAALVDRAVAYIEAQSWIAGSLALKKQQRESEREQRQAAKAAAKNSHEYRIAKRWEQIWRLERKIKALNTRLKSAKRSLGALERAKVRKDEDERIRMQEEAAQEEAIHADAIRAIEERLNLLPKLRTTYPNDGETGASPDGEAGGEFDGEGEIAGPNRRMDC